MITNHKKKYWACFGSYGCLFVSRELATVVVVINIINTSMVIARRDTSPTGN